MKRADRRALYASAYLMILSELQMWEADWETVFGLAMGLMIVPVCRLLLNIWSAQSNTEGEG